MKKMRLIAAILSFAIFISVCAVAAFGYNGGPTAEGNEALEAIVYDYTKPVGVTMQRLTGSCKTETDNLGDDFLFVIKSDDRYYAMKDVAASETAYASIPAVDVTDWVNADGSLTVPADTLGVAFQRYEERPDYELGMFINGHDDYLAYTESYESADGDDDYYNDAERTYSAEFVIRSFEDGQYIIDPYYWSENGVSGTLHYNGSWSYYPSDYNSTTMRYAMIVDLRNDGTGGKEFYFRYLGTNVEYVGNEVEGYLYYSDCRHQFTVRHAEYDAPTCMLKGCEEYWYCEGCDEYYADEAMTQLFGEEMPVIPATGHDFDNEKCKNCDRPVPVYSKVTNQAQFDALADDTMYILVAEYNGKHYAMDFSEVYSYMTDSDGDGFYDIHDVDEDSDGIPDYLEFDEGGGGEWRDEPNGVYDYLEWDMDNDGDVDDYDLHEFHIMVCDQHLTDMLYNNESINATEITINSDGTISHEEAKKTAEFEMVDVYLAEDYDPDWHSHWENGEMPYHTKCVKQFVIPNYFLSAPSMRPIERMYQQRIYEFGDSSHWGVLFYDSRDQYFSYTDGNMDEKVDADEDGKPDPLPFPDVSQEGSVAVFDTFDDIMWILYDEGQMAQLRLRDYNGTIGFVTGHDYELDGYEWIYDETTETGYYDTNDTQVCVYLYASQQVSHTCEFGDWIENAGENTHTRTCIDEDCQITETEPHSWNGGVQTKAPTCTEAGVITYACTDCAAIKTRIVQSIGHSFGEWTNEGDCHIRTCQNSGCMATEDQPHDWSNWESVGAEQHSGICTVCLAEKSEPHSWDGGTVTKEPTDFEEGEMTFTCTVCGQTRTEIIEKTEHIHSWTDWITDGEENHKRECVDSQCGETETAPHSWDGGTVTKEPTDFEEGEMTFTCTVCGQTRTEIIEKTEHIHSFGSWTSDDGSTHTRECVCGESETENHTIQSEVINWETCDLEGQNREWCEICGYENYTTRPPMGHFWDDGVVTTAPTKDADGIKTYTCNVCSATEDKTIPKSDHQQQLENEEFSATVQTPEGSAAYLPEGTTLEVEEVTEELPVELIGDIEITVEGSVKPIACYDISLLYESIEIAPDGKVIVTLPPLQQEYDYDRITVVYIAPDGSFEECKTTLNDDGSISFETDHFSRYALIGVTNEKDGLGVGAIIAIVIGSLALAGGIGFCLYWFVLKKKII